LKTCGYYDVVNFARLVKIPGLYTWDSMTKPARLLPCTQLIMLFSAEKVFVPGAETGHWTFPEQTEKLNKWLADKLLIK
jgi:hypothetical protein